MLYGCLLEAAKATASGYHKKKDFMENSLVIARAGTLKHLDDYFEKAKSSDKVGNWHRLGEIDFRQPQDAPALRPQYQLRYLRLQLSQL